MLLIFIPLLIIWTFAILDIFQREDLTGWLRAVWVLVVLLLPFVGTFIYLVFRPREAVPDKAAAVLSELHERGKLSDAEYAEEMTRMSDHDRT